jgi:hypothetical protein
MEFDCTRSSRFVELMCSMKHLEELNLFGYQVNPDDLVRVFQSCSKLTNLYIGMHHCKTFEMDKHLKNQLKSGFQKLRRLRLDFFIDKHSWAVIQEMLT